ncbi:MAG TPA: L-serine ammonia-lyase [Acidobacteriota bacterium]|nr:L-serine ammonia-lyase [Acidobacteriota bacterium]
MALSVFDLLKIGVGPSSSHTGGPMRAAREFTLELRDAGLIDSTAAIGVELYGSLAATGKGHGTDHAILLGLEGDTPEAVDTGTLDARISAIRDTGRLWLLGTHPLPFRTKEHLLFRRRENLPGHPNGMRFTAFDGAGAVLRTGVFYSVGGGFVVSADASVGDQVAAEPTSLPHRFRSAADLLDSCAKHDMSVSQLMLENERVWRSDDEIRAGLLELWEVMKACIERGCHASGVLPGGLEIPRRAPQWHQDLSSKEATSNDPLQAIDWVSMWAVAVNEENAAGGRVVTAPTNGAAGIIPAVLRYYEQFVPGANDDGIVSFLLTAGAIGILYKENASISGAEVGCQGEIGAACSMAAGALAEVLGGSPAHVENAAEIGMEHNLGLTCDPVGGLVQIPCIERNAMGAVKAINAARMSLRGDGEHFVSLDKVIKTMRDTGADMKTKYKETARGGLAMNLAVPVSFIEC